MIRLRVSPRIQDSNMAKVVGKGDSGIKKNNNENLSMRLYLGNASNMLREYLSDPSALEALYPNMARHVVIEHGPPPCPQVPQISPG